jgi:radical SAM protein with 4Fe4S-binding SPASM domain
MFKKLAQSIKGALTRGARPARHLRLYVDTNWTCNLACRMCLHSAVAVSPVERGSMPWPLFQKIAREVFPLATHVSLSCTAEPLLSQTFFRALPHIRRYNVPFVDFVTNGTLLDNNNIDAIVSSGIDLMQVSIDSADKTVFEKVRRGANFDKLIANLEAFTRAKEQRGVDKPALRISAVLMRSTIEGVEDLMKLAHGLGADGIVFRHLAAYRPLYIQAESLFNYQNLANQYIEKAKALAPKLAFNVFCIPDKFGDDKISDAEHSRCGFPDTIVISPKGDIIPCEAHFLYVSMGNLATQSFDQIWNSPRYAALREDFAAGRLPDVCKTCPAVVSKRSSDPMAFQEITHPAYAEVIELFMARAPFNEEVARRCYESLAHYSAIKPEYDLSADTPDTAAKIERWQEWYNATLRIHEKFQKEGPL